MTLDAQSVLIVGGTRGIGAAIATDLAAHGAHVGVAGRDVAAARELVARIGADGGRAIAIGCDATNDDDTAQAVAQVVEAFGKLDTVFANQGVAGPSVRLTEWPESKIRLSLEVNLISAITLARHAEGALAASGGGRFIATGSGSAREANERLGLYSISKAALSQFVRQLSVEWRRHPIAVNELVPGPVRTAMTGFPEGGAPDPRIAEAFEGFLADKGEWLKEPADVAPLARLLAGFEPTGPSGQIFSLAGRVTGS